MAIKAKLSKETYDKPTPKLMRKIGDSLLIVGTTITGVSALIAAPWVTIVAAFSTMAGKIIANFTEEDET